VLLPPTRSRSRLDYHIGASFLVGTTLGALVTVTTAWVLGGFTAPLPGRGRAALIGVGAVVVWICERGPLADQCTLPQARRQIPAEVFGRGLVRGALRFGFELGTGVRTYVPSPAPYVLMLTLLLGQLTLGCALSVAVGFGLGRAAPLLLQLFPAKGDRFRQVFLRGVTDIAPIATTCVVLAGAFSLV
jgi:hypothetical protein